MTQIQKSIISRVQKLTLSERREIISRLLAAQTAEVGTIWKTVRFGATLRVVAYAIEHECFVESLRKLLQDGALVRIENEAEGTCEVYGSDRTFYVTMSEKREFVGLLSSWTLDAAPREINVAE